MHTLQLAEQETATQPKPLNEPPSRDRGERDVRTEAIDRYFEGISVPRYRTDDPSPARSPHVDSDSAVAAALANIQSGMEDLRGEVRGLRLQLDIDRALARTGIESLQAEVRQSLWSKLKNILGISATRAPSARELKALNQAWLHIFQLEDRSLCSSFQAIDLPPPALKVDGLTGPAIVREMMPDGSLSTDIIKDAPNAIFTSLVPRGQTIDTSGGSTELPAALFTESMREKMTLRMTVTPLEMKYGSIVTKYDTTVTTKRSFVASMTKDGKVGFDEFENGGARIFGVETKNPILSLNKATEITIVADCTAGTIEIWNGTKKEETVETEKKRVTKMDNNDATIGIGGLNGGKLLLTKMKITDVSMMAGTFPPGSKLTIAVPDAIPPPAPAVATAPAGPRPEATVRSELEAAGKRKAEIEAILAKTGPITMLDGSKAGTPNGNEAAVSAEVANAMLRDGFRVEARLKMTSRGDGVIVAQYGLGLHSMFTGVTPQGSVVGYVYGPGGAIYGGETPAGTLKIGEEATVVIHLDLTIPSLKFFKNDVPVDTIMTDRKKVEHPNQTSTTLESSSMPDDGGRRRFLFPGPIYTLTIGPAKSDAPTADQRKALKTEMDALIRQIAAGRAELMQSEIADVTAKLGTARAQGFALRQGLIDALAQLTKTHPELAASLEDARLLQQFLAGDRSETREVTGRFSYSIKRDDRDQTLTFTYRNAAPGWVLEFGEGDSPRQNLPLVAGAGEQTITRGVGRGKSARFWIRDTVTGEMMALELGGAAQGDGGVENRTPAGVPDRIDAHTQDFDPLLRSLLQLFPTPRLAALTPAMRQMLAPTFASIMKAPEKTDLELAHAIDPTAYGATPEADRKLYAANFEKNKPLWGNGTSRILDDVRKQIMTEVMKRKAQAWEDTQKAAIDAFFVAWHALTNTSADPFWGDLKAENRPQAGASAVYPIDLDGIPPKLGILLIKMIDVCSLPTAPVAGPVSPQMRAKADEVLKSKDATIAPWKEAHMDELLAAAAGTRLPTGVVAYVLGHPLGPLVAIRNGGTVVAVNTKSSPGINKDTLAFLDPSQMDGKGGAEANAATSALSDVLSWYNSSLSFPNRNVNSSTLMGKAFIAATNKLLNGNIQDKELAANRLASITGISATKIYTFGTKIGANLFKNTESFSGTANAEIASKQLALLWERAGYENIFKGTGTDGAVTSAMPGKFVGASDIDGNKLSNDLTTYRDFGLSAEKSIRVRYDVRPAPGMLRPDHVAVYLADSQGHIIDAVHPLAYATGAGPMYIDVPLPVLYKFLGSGAGKLLSETVTDAQSRRFQAAAFKLQVVATYPGKNAPSYSRITDALMRAELTGTGEDMSNIMDLSTNADPLKHAKENKILNILSNAQKFPLRDPLAGEWSWNIASEFHDGDSFNAADLTLPGSSDSGKLVRAPADGEVVSGGDGTDGTHTVILKHTVVIDGKNESWYSKYLHMNNIGVREPNGSISPLSVGTVVKENSVFGEVSDHGSEGQFHMHLEILTERTGQAVDLRKLLVDQYHMKVNASDAGPDGSQEKYNDNASRPVRWNKVAGTFEAFDRATGKSLSLLLDRSAQNSPTNVTSANSNQFWKAWQQGKKLSEMETVVWVESLPSGEKVNAWVKASNYSYLWNPEKQVFVPR